MNRKKAREVAHKNGGLLSRFTTKEKIDLQLQLEYKNSRAKQNDGGFRLRREVGFLTGVSLIVSTMIGSGIFISPKGVFREMGSVGAGFLVWISCGVLATFGALSYSEVGTMIPKSGGDYPILLEAFGPVPAFLFAWTSATVLEPSSFGILSMTFAEYALSPVFPDCEVPKMAIKLTAVLVVGTVVFANCYSIRLSTKFINLFTAGKILSLTVIIIGGIFMLATGNTSHFENSFEGEVPGFRRVVTAFYQGLWAYDGWNQLNYVVGELKNPYVNLPRAIATSMMLVTGLYIMCNVAYLSAMSRIELLNAPAVGTLFGERVLGAIGWVIPIFVAWSVLGSCLTSCFTAGRIPYSAGREGHFNVILSMIHVKRLTPTPAVLLNGFLTVLMIIPNDFDTLIEYFAFCMWTIHFGTCSALIYFRIKQPNRKRPIKIPIVIPVFVCIAAIGLVVAPIVENPQIHHLYAVLYVLFGLVFYVPFVHFKVKSPIIRELNIMMQKLLEVCPEEDEIAEK